MPITPGSPLDPRTYQSGLILESKMATPMRAFDGEEDSPAAFPVVDREGVGRGSTVRRVFAKVNRTEEPKTKIVVGQEAETALHYDDVSMQYLAFDGFIENWVEEQNLVTHDVRAREIWRQAQQWGYNDERSILNQLTGNTLVNTAAGYGLSGGNIVTAQNTANIYRARTSAPAVPATDAAVAADATCVLDSRSIDDLVTFSNSTAWLDWPIVPCDTPFGPLYVLVCHGTGYQQLKENTSGSDIYDLHKALLQGGQEAEDSPLFDGEGFIYNNTLVLKSDFCPQGITSGAAQANTRCAAFFGQNAGAWVYGEGYAGSENHLGYTEHQVHRRLSIGTDTVRGFKRTIVNDKSWAAIRVVHYSAV